MQRELDVGALNLGQSSLGPRQLVDERLQDLAGLAIAQLGRFLVGRQRHAQDGNGYIAGMVNQAVTIQ